MSRYLYLYGFAIFAYGIGNFAFSMWVYQDTKSIASFTAVGIAAILPAFILTPLAGVIIDRITPQKALQYSSSVMALSWLVLGTALFLSAPITVLFIPLIVMGAFMSLQTPAYFALISEMVAPEKHANMNGLFGILAALGGIGAPFVAGLLIEQLDIAVICMVPFVALVVQALGLASLPRHKDVDKPHEDTVLESITKVLRYMKGRKELLLLLVFGIMINSAAEIAGVVLTPFSLDSYGENKTGILMTVAGVGALVGNIALSALPALGNKKIVLLFAINVLQGCLLIVLTQSAMTYTLVLVAMLTFFILEALYDGIDTSYWQGAVPENMRASILSYKSMSSLLAILIAYFLAAPLVATIASGDLGKGSITGLLFSSENSVIKVLTIVGLANLVIVAFFSIAFVVRSFLSDDKPEMTSNTNTAE